MHQFMEWNKDGVISFTIEFTIEWRYLLIPWTKCHENTAKIISPCKGDRKINKWNVCV
jgi:hypothetical protein